VIPFSVEKTGRVAFIISRFFRIYPTYVAGLLIVLSAVWVSCRYWQNPLPWSTGVLIQNLTLINSLTGAPSIDLVNWTLSIEVKFYLVCCILATSIRRGAIWPLIAASFTIFCINIAWRTPLGTEFEFIIFMFIGVIFNYLMRGVIELRSFAAAASILCGLFFLGWRATPWPHDFAVIAPNYAYALAIFSLAYISRNRFRNFLLLDFLAAISYPLYVTHSLVGYVVMRYMFSQKYPPIAIEIVTAALLLIVAYAVHRLIEVPATAMGKRPFSSRSAIPA
jgi:peptidoglycan/LPS O-acetylase OafA/YrhL